MSDSSKNFVELVEGEIYWYINDFWQSPEGKLCVLFKAKNFDLDPDPHSSQGGVALWCNNLYCDLTGPITISQTMLRDGLIVKNKEITINYI